MTIQITSTTDAPENVTAAMGQAKTGEKEGEAKSAPAAKEATEQKESTESDTEENEATEANVKDESGESEADEATDKADESASDKPKKKGGFQKRIDKLNARYSDKEREAEYWRNLALKNSAGEVNAESVDKKPAVADGKPNPDKFDTHAEYVEALADWKTEQKLNERDQKQAKSQLEIEQANLLKSHSERVKSFADKTDDFSETLESVDDIRVSPTVQEIIISSENGPALMYELAKNREEYARICKLSPLAAARELGKLEAKLAPNASEEKKPETKKITKAPKPIDPVGAKAASGGKSIYDTDLSQKEYERLRAKQRSAG